MKLAWLLSALLPAAVMTSLGASLCTNGILDDSQSVCCPAKCGKCGGPRCSRRPGAQRCCVGSNTAVLCLTPHDVACGMPRQTGFECWPHGVPLSPLLVPPSAFYAVPAPVETAAFTGRVDVLQVTATVDCVVAENVARLHAAHFLKGAANASHVIITPDLSSCILLASRFAHLRCVSDSDIFQNAAVNLAAVTALVERTGPRAGLKGGKWYWQQMLKLQAVASGLNGLLGKHVKVCLIAMLSSSHIKSLTFPA